jgi:glycogen synthase
MKVLLVGDYPPPHGGVAIHVKQLHHYLRSRGVEVKVLNIGKGGRPDPDVLPVQSGVGFVTRLRELSSAGYSLHLHTSGNNPKSWLVAASCGAAGLAASVPRVITLHSGLLPAFLSGSMARRLFARAVLSSFSRIVAVSESIRCALIDCGVSEEKIQVLPAFCSSQVVPGSPPARFENVRQRRTPLLAMAHHPSPVYGRTLMFQALKLTREHYPDVGLAVFGPGTLSSAFVAEARNAGVLGLIEDFGELEHEQALALISRCDAFIRPTQADGDAISVREALALGVPCVASDVAARPPGTYLFRGGEAADLVKTLCEALVQGAPLVDSFDAGPEVLKIHRRLANSREGKSLGEPYNWRENHAAH